MPRGRLLTWLLLGAVAWPAFPLTLDVQVEGLPERELAAVLAHLDIERERSGSELLPSRVRRLHTRGPDQIREALEPFGLYRARVSGELREEGEAWTARYVVEPGDPIRIEAVDLQVTAEGAEDRAVAQQVRGFPLKPGDPLDHGAYEGAKRSLQQVVAARGYLSAELRRHVVEVDLERYAARVVLELDTGPRYRFGPVAFDQDTFDPRFLARYLPFEPGQAYGTAELLQLQNWLADSDYFASVDVVPEMGAARDGEVPISVRLEPRPRQRYRFGLGYGTDTGARATLGWEQRWVNRFGHRVGADLKLSERLNDLDAYYLIPLANPATEALRVEVQGRSEDTVTFRTDVASAAVGRSVVRKDWRETLRLRYEYEDYDVGGDSGTSRLLMPEAQWVTIESDNELYPRKGHRLGLDLRGAAEQVFSDNSFLRTRFQAKAVRRVGEDGRILVRADGGFTLASSVEALPASQRFFAGGDQSVRGYALDELGPTDGAGKVVGGRYLAVGSVEYEHRVSGKWSVAAFYDAGNAFEPDELTLKEGAGLGVRWLSPVGPVRVDVASALSEEDQPLRLHLVIGPDL